MSRVLVKKFKHYSVFKFTPKVVDREDVHKKAKKWLHSMAVAKKEIAGVSKRTSYKFERYQHSIRLDRARLRDLVEGENPWKYQLVHHKTRTIVNVMRLDKEAVAMLQRQVSMVRRNLKKQNDPDQRQQVRIGRIGYSYRIAHVHDKGGEIYALLVAKKIHELGVPKKPKDNQAYVGIEFEFTSDVERTDLGLMLFNAGLVNCCELKTDGSLRPMERENGYEIAVLLKEKSFQKPLKALCDIFEKINAQVDGRRCGLHVHLDVRRRRKEIVYYYLVSCQALLMKMIPKDRRNGEFCARVTSKSFPSNFNGGRRERYKSINAAAFYRHGTLEVRMHEGSTNFKDVRNWVTLLLKIASIRTRLTKSVASLGTLKKTMKLSDVMSIHVQDRINKWNILTPTEPRRPRNSASEELRRIVEAEQRAGPPRGTSSDGLAQSAPEFRIARTSPVSAVATLAPLEPPVEERFDEGSLVFFDENEN